MISNLMPLHVEATEQELIRRRRRIRRRLPFEENLRNSTACDSFLGRRGNDVMML